MPGDSADNLKQRLRRLGLSPGAIEAAWPEWWSKAADASASAKAELRFSLARKLGLDPHSLLEDGTAPRFVWREAAKFKHLSGETEDEQAAISSFGAALGGVLVSATGAWRSIIGVSASELRKAILADRPFVELRDLLATCWSFGIPTVHLQVFPLTQKRMAAMTVRVGQRSAILLGRDSQYPALIAFYVAHELAHIALGHLQAGRVMVDLELPEGCAETDPEELAADCYALELLTGKPEPVVLSSVNGVGARSLADVALKASEGLGIEPGTLALCYAYSAAHAGQTGARRAWALANAAMPYIYSSSKPVWHEVNSVALQQLSLEVVSADARSYLAAVLGTRAVQ